MNEKLAEIQNRISSVQKEMHSIKNDFQALIKNVDIPLDERWAVFKMAPSELKHGYSWVQHFDFEDSFAEIVGEEFTWYDTFYAERHQTVYASNILNHLEDRIVKEGKDISEYNWVTHDIIRTFKEEVLSLAMESFVYDW